MPNDLFLRIFSQLERDGEFRRLRVFQILRGFLALEDLSEVAGLPRVVDQSLLVIDWNEKPAVEVPQSVPISDEPGTAFRNFLEIDPEILLGACRGQAHVERRKTVADKLGIEVVEELSISKSSL